MKNIIKPLTKSILIPLGLTAAAATDGAIQKNRSGPGTTTLIISNEEMNDLIKVVKSLQESGLLIKEVSEKIKNDEKNLIKDFSLSIKQCFHILCSAKKKKKKKKKKRIQKVKTNHGEDKNQQKRF